MLVGIGIGFIFTSILDYYLAKKRLSLNYGLLAIIVSSLWFIYSAIGIFIGSSYTKDNGNVCQGFKYGIHICSGDINAE